MDGELIFWIVLLAFYLLSQIFGKKKKPPPPVPTELTSAETEEAREPEFTEALRELRQILGAPTPAPAPPPVAKAPAPTGEDAFEQRPAFDERFGGSEERFEQAPFHRKHGEGPHGGSADEQFESRPLYSEFSSPIALSSASSALPSGELTKLPAFVESRVIGLPRRSQHSDKQASNLVQLRARLRDQKSIREAIQLSVILGPPRSQHPPGT